MEFQILLPIPFYAVLADLRFKHRSFRHTSVRDAHLMHMRIGRPAVMHSPSVTRLAVYEFHREPSFLFPRPAWIEASSSKCGFDLCSLIGQHA